MAKKRWWYVLIAVQVLFLALAGAILFTRGGLERQRPAQLPTTAGGATTVWTGESPPVALADAEALAGTAARAWAADAILARVEATWRPTGEWMYIESLPVSWSFSYYSSAKRAVMPVAVSGEKVLTTAQLALPGPLTPLASFPPAQDVDVAWLTFRAAGGERFLQEHSGAAVQLRLQMADGRPTWFVLAFTPEAHFQVNVDAETGLLAQP